MLEIEKISKENNNNKYITSSLDAKFSGKKPHIFTKQ